MTSLSSAYAIVTGASSGIGRCISYELVKRGYSLVAVSNQPPQLEELKKDLERKFGINVYTLNTDLSNETSASVIFDFCKEKNLEVEVLVNNAGMFIFSEITKADPLSYRSMLTLHVTTPALLCRLFGEMMASQQKGYILNVSSITAVMPYPGISIYGPTKTFFRYFTRALRAEMKLDNIYVTCLIPGATDTGLYSTENVNVKMLKRFGLMKRPEEVARAAVMALFRNRAECIPGFINKIVLRLMPLIPRVVINMLTANTDLVRKRGKTT